ncbi:Response regulatory domain-containing protein [Pseudomonas chlororaphis]|uniref:hypothetical protein n=1 Tax=Pseudomonas chlororaphis TaxID=587753 RepID=UPI0039E034FB
MSFKGYLVDDTVEDAVYARLLSSKVGEGLALEYLQVSEAVALTNHIFNSNIDIVLLDFRLDENPGMISPEHAYKGSGLAQLLRDKAMASPEKDIPIVLISAEDKFRSFFRPDRTAHDLFDVAYGKDQASADRSKIQRQLISLCEGYRLLKSYWDADRMSIFSENSDDLVFFDNQDITSNIRDAAAPHIAARAVMKNLIERNGVLLTTSEALARLGIDKSGHAELEELLNNNNIGYNGIFSSGWPRWFAHRFDSFSEEILKKRPSNLTGNEKCKILNEKTGLNFKPAKSTWNQSSDEKFIFSCASCSEPTEIRHSLSAYDPTCPRHAQRRRICWDCVQTDKYIERCLKIDEIDLGLVEEIKHKERK